MSEVETWFGYAEADLNTAKYLADGGIYYACAFYCQQSIEKALKALLIKKEERLIKTHSVRKLAKILELSEDLKDKVSELEDVERLSRYPIGDEISEDRYSKKDIDRFLIISEEVLEWIKNKL